MVQVPTSTTKAATIVLLTLCSIQLGVLTGNRAEARCTVTRGERQEKPSDIPSQWKEIIGEYTLGSDTVCILERDSALYLLTRATHLYPLRETAENRFAVAAGWSHGDTARVFKQNAEGHAVSFATRAGVFKRIAFGGDHGSSFRIRPLKTADVLRSEALRATPPREEGNFLEPDLIELKLLDSTIHLDVRYATTNNFMGEKFYSHARAFLQRPAAEALVRAHRALREQGYGLLIHDAYRPWYVTKMFWDATPNEQKIFVADPAKGSRHNRGCAVDLSLYDLKTGRAVEMVSGYDEFSHRAYPEYPGGTSLQRWHRELLRHAMKAQGFRVFEWEWWHFDHETWKRYPIGTVTFEEIH